MVACVGMLASAAFAEQVDNPQYQSWSKFKPGTTVTMKSDSVMKVQGNEMKNASTITTKLLDISPTEATVETTMLANGQESKLPPQKIPAKTEKAAVPADAPKADMKEGTDKVEIAGKTYNAKTVETTSDANGMKTTSKTWMSDEVPGGMLKMESNSTGSMESKTTMTLVEVKTP
jgi:hypothetical protein